MQEMRTPTGEVHREFATGKKAEIDAHFDKRRAELEAKVYPFVGRGKLSRNAPCPCRSGLKFKRCCVSLVVRAGGATFLKGQVVDEARAR